MTSGQKGAERSLSFVPSLVKGEMSTPNRPPRGRCWRSRREKGTTSERRKETGEICIWVYTQSQKSVIPNKKIGGGGTIKLGKYPRGRRKENHASNLSDVRGRRVFARERGFRNLKRVDKTFRRQVAEGGGCGTQIGLGRV